jgi:hypothetical protein
MSRHFRLPTEDKEMNRIAIAMAISLCFVAQFGTADQKIKLGFLSDTADLEPVAKGAYEFAKQNYQTTLLIVEKGGEFKDESGNLHSLNEFPILWSHYSVSGTIPESFLSGNTTAAIKDYITEGGTMFLTAVALKYVFSLGIEPNEPRTFGPLGKPDRGINAVEKDHPVFKGLDVEKLIVLSEIDQPGSTSDFWNIDAGPAGMVLGKTGKESQFTEYTVGAGKVIVLGHHSPVYTDGGSDNLKILTSNVIEYLASHSVISPVYALDKISVTWGEVKAQSQ